MPLSDEGKRSAVAVVNDSPVGCQSRDRARRSELAFAKHKPEGKNDYPSVTAYAATAPLTRGAVDAPLRAHGA